MTYEQMHKYGVRLQKLEDSVKRLEEAVTKLVVMQTNEQLEDEQRNAEDGYLLYLYAQQCDEEEEQRHLDEYTAEIRALS